MTLVELMHAGAVAASLACADRAGILHALADAPDTSDRLAARLRLDPRATGLVLEMLTLAGVLELEGELHRLSPGVVQTLRFPLAQAPGQMFEFWAGLQTWLTTGRSPSAVLSSASKGRDEVYRVVAPLLEAEFGPSAALLADIVIEHVDPLERILDAGAGSAVWSRAVVDKSNAFATALDLPLVIDALETKNLERFDFIAGDYHEVGLPRARFDAVIAAGVLHLESEPRAAALVERLATATRSGGIVAIVDMFSDGTAARDEIRTAYALHLGLRVNGGRPHERQTIERWLARAECEPCGFQPLTGGSAAVLGRRR